MWMATSGGKGRKAQKKAGAKRGEERRKGWWLKRENLIRKVHRDQQGLGPRLRVARHAVGAKARFWAQHAILCYTTIASHQDDPTTKECRSKSTPL